MRPVPGTRTAQVVVLVLVLTASAVGLWAVAAARTIGDDELAAARVHLDTDTLLGSPVLSELPGAQGRELRDELQTQRDALPQPSQRALERVAEDDGGGGGDEGGGTGGTGVDGDESATLPARLLETAGTLLRSPAGSPQERALHTSMAAHRIGTAVELGTEPAAALRVLPVLDTEDALPAPAEDARTPSATGGQPHPELALARQLDQFREAELTWVSLDPQQRPTSARGPALDPVRDGAWWATTTQRHPSVIDGALGMPERFRTAPDEAQDGLIEALEDTALAQAAAAHGDAAGDDQDAPSPVSTSADPGSSVLVRLAVADAEASRPIVALPGLDG